MSASPKFYIGDPKLVARLKQYLDDNGKCDVDSMIEHLQNTYSEYRRKKVNSLKSSVEKVRLMLLESQSSEELGHACSHCQRAGRPRTDESTEENSFSSDGEYVETQDQNRMNSLVTSLYKSTSSGTSTPQPARSTVSSAAASPRPSSKHTCVDGSLPFFIDKVGDRLASSNGNLIPSVKQHHRLGFIKKGLPEAYSSLSVDSPLSTRTVVDSDHPVSTVLQPQSVSCQSEKRMADDRYVASCKRPKKFKPSSSPPSATSSPAKQPVGSPAPGDRAAVVDVGSGESAVATTRSTPHATKRQNKAHQAGLGDKPKSGAKPRAAPKEVQYSNVRFADVGGNDETMLKICKMLVHMKHPEVYSQIGITPPRGFLLHGPPGCGKTLLAQAIAGELQLPLIKVAATEMVSGVSGESEERLRDLFDQAVDAAPSVLFIDEIDAITPKRETASKDMERRMVAQLLSCMDDLSSKSAAPVLVIGATNRPDSLDAALRRAGRFDHEICLGIPGEAARRRILEVLCRILKLHESCDLGELARLTPGFVGADLMALTRDAAMVAIERSLNMMQTQSSVVGKSNLSDLQTQLREHPISQQDTATADAAAAGTSRPSQADSSCSNETTASVKPLVVAPAPTIIADPLAVVTPHELSPDSSPGGSALPPMASHGAASGHSTDVLQSALQSVLSWLKECPPLSSEQLQSFCILPDDFKQALEHLQPSAKREGFATVPDVTWADIGALHSVREELQMAVLAPIKYPQYFQMLGLTSPSGILLAGPPGCGKTLLAKAIANESGINFISVKGPELLNMYVGESERAVRQVFQRARNSVPCVIFFDELDALCPRRSDSGEGGSSVRVVNQLLTEMDGLEARKQVFILGATNRPDIIDPAILRPGRLDKVLFVDLPTSEERLDILRTITKCGRPALAPDVSLHDVAAAAQDFTGADLSALVRETSLAALKELMTSVSSLTNAAAAPELAVRKEHFDIAFSKVKPSVSAKDRAIYSTLRLSLSRQ